MLKTAIYRVISVIVTFFLTLALGGTMAQALTFGLAALVIGAVHYYIYDRIWVLIPWRRSESGDERTSRSLVKAIIYRITVILVVALLARAIFTDSNVTAFLMASIKFAINAMTYYVLERKFNCIEWGKTNKNDPLMEIKII
jgi:uncharacterized membrane protein